MKKLLLSLLASALIVQFASAQALSISYGSPIAAGATTFTNADSIAIGFLDGDTFTSFHSTVTAPGPGGVAGFANGFYEATDFAFTGENAVIQVTAGSNIGYVSSSAWTQPIASSAPPATPSANVFTLSGTDASIFTLTNIVVDPGLTGIGGLGLSVVPEPSTYALLAGFAAFIFVAIRRRNS
jgi:hypothetical protein